MANIKGKKGGSSSPRTPVESPDSLHSIATAKILLALGEGEIAGGITAKDIFLDGTPIESIDGTVNYPGVTWEFRTGTQMQDYIPGMPAVENEITINTALKATQPWTRAISNTQLSAVRVRIAVPALQQQRDDGDVVGYRVDYKIELSTDGGGYSTVLNGAFDGKTTSLYERSHRIDLPKATTGWQVRISRSTPDSTSNRITDTTNIAAYSEIIDAKLRYPNTALLFVTFDAKQFNNIPQISVKARGRIIRVPSNYDPTSRTYSGAWDGSFKWAYSNNPAWVFYDVLLNERFGLGDRISSSQVDKWELYRIAQYCDQLVPDGRGGIGTEPRFLCDVYIQSQEEAFTVLRDLASIFRGMTYWSNNQVVAIADMPAANDERNYIYTRSNVVGGKFIYSGGSERDRYSTAMVSFSNPDNHYADEPEPVFEADLVRRYGVRETSITAIGCTRRTEANRRGRWVLLTNAKDRLITFDAGLDGFIPQPGKIIYVADQGLSGRIMGGRVSSVNGRVITLDRIPDAVAGDRLLVNLPSGKSEARTVQAVNGRLVTVSTAWSTDPEPEAVWSVDAKDVAIQQYRVTSVKDNGDNTFTISGVYHNPDKYAAIDSGARLDERPISAIPPGVQGPPTEVSITSYSRIVQGLNVETMRVSWLAPNNAIAYECQWRKDNGDWVSMPRTSSLGFEVEGIYSGRYKARVRAINASDISSVWGSSQETGLTGKIGNPPKPLGFMASENVVFGIELNWNFPANTGDTLKTEIQYSSTGKVEDAILLTDVPYPQRRYQQMGLKSGQVFWYRAQLVDKTGNQSGYTDWVRGVASTDASDILDYLAGKIDETHLGQELSGKLGSISDNQEALSRAIVESQLQIADNRKQLDEKSARLSTRIEDVRTDLSDAEERLRDDIDVLDDKAERNAADIDDTRHALSQSEQRLQGNIDAVDSAVAKNVTDIDAINRAAIEAQLQISQNREDLSQQSEKLKTDVSAVRNELELASTSLSQSVDGVLKEVSSVSKEVAATQENLTTARSDIDARIKEVQVDIDSNADDIEKTRSELTESASRLDKKIDDITGGFEGDLSAVIESVDIVRDGLKTEVSRVDAVITRVDGNESAIKAEEIARVEGDQAITESLRVVTAATKDNSSKIATLEQAVSDGESSSAALKQSLEAVSRANIESDLAQTTAMQEQREISARLTTRQNVLANSQEAQASQIIQLDAEFGETAARLQQSIDVVAQEGNSTASSMNALASKVDENQADVISRLSTVATEMDSESARLDSVSVKTEANEAAISSESKARSEADNALGSRLDVIEVSSGDNSAAITELRNAQTTLESSQASVSQSLEAVSKANIESGLKQEGDKREQGEINARIITQQTVLADAAQAQAKQITQMDSQFGDAVSQLQTSTETLATADIALGKRIDAINADFAGNKAEVLNQLDAIADDVSAQATVISGIASDVSGNTSAIAEERKVRSEADSAIAHSVSQVSAETKENSSKIITLTEAQSSLDDAQVKLSQSLEAAVDGQRDINAGVTEKLSAQASNLDAQSERIVGIDAKFDGAVASLQASDKALSEEGKAQAERLSEVSTKVDENDTAVRQLVTSVSDELHAESRRIDDVIAQSGDNKAAIQQEVLARTDSDSALGKRIDGIATSTGDNAAALTEIRESQADLAKAQARVTQSLEAVNRAQIEGSLKQSGDVQEQREVSARIITQQEVFTSGLDAQTRRLTQMDSQFGESTARLQEETKTLASDGKALSERVGAVDAKVDQNAAVARDQTQAVADNLSAEAKRVSALGADVDGVKSDIQAEQKARTDGDKALAESLSVVKTATEKTDAKVVTLEQAQSSLESAQASTTQSLEAINRAQIESDLKREDDVKAQREVSAKLTTQQTVLADTQQAQARQLTQFDAKHGEATARLQEETETLAKADEALSQRFTSLDSKVDDNAAAAREQLQTVATDLAAESRRLSELSAETESNKAGIQAEQKARTDGDKSLAESIGVVKTATEEADAKIVSLEKSQSTLESAQASTAQSLEASFSKAALSDDALARAQLEQALKQTEDDKTQRQVSAKITASQQVTTDELKAQGERISSIDTKYGDATAKLAQQDLVLSAQNQSTVEQLQALSATVGDNAAKATQETKAVSDALSAEVKRVDDLTTTVGNNTAGIQSEAKARADADSAIAQTVTGLSSRTEGAESAIIGLQKTQSDTTKALTETQQSLSATQTDVEGQAQSIARVDNAQKATADNVSALSQDLSIVSSEVGDVKASAQQSMTAITELDGKISASWSMRVEIDQNGNPIVAGLGLGVDGEGNSQFLVYANRFAIIATENGQSYSPFIVENNQAFFNSAFFKKASIDFAVITDSLKSDNFVSGENGKGWNLPKSGNAELNNVTVRGHVEATSGKFDNVEINNSLIVRNLKKASGIISALKTVTSAPADRVNPNIITVIVNTGVIAPSWIDSDQKVMGASVGMSRDGVIITSSYNTQVDFAIAADKVFIKMPSSGAPTYHIQVSLSIWSDNVYGARVDLTGASPTWKLQEIT